VASYHFAPMPSVVHLRPTATSVALPLLCGIIVPYLYTVLLQPTLALNWPLGWLAFYFLATTSLFIHAYSKLRNRFLLLLYGSVLALYLATFSTQLALGQHLFVLRHWNDLTLMAQPGNLVPRPHAIYGVTRYLDLDELDVISDAKVVTPLGTIDFTSGSWKNRLGSCNNLEIRASECQEYKKLVDLLNRTGIESVEYGQDGTCILTLGGAFSDYAGVLYTSSNTLPQHTMWGNIYDTKPLKPHWYWWRSRQ
jgi:hypothetical protein